MMIFHRDCLLRSALSVVILTTNPPLSTTPPCFATKFFGRRPKHFVAPIYSETPKNEVFRRFLAPRRGEILGSEHFRIKEGSFRVVSLLKIHVWESVCRCISIQQSITRSGRMLSDEFLIDLDYVQPVQRCIRPDFLVSSILSETSFHTGICYYDIDDLLQAPK